MRNKLQTGFVLLAVVAFWQILSSAGIINPFILPAPKAIILSFAELLADGRLFTHVLVSLRRVLIGFFISVATAIPLGLLLGMNSKLKGVFGPLIDFLRPIPPIAWIPLAILWFGIGNGPSYFITMIASFFPIFINTLAGVENISKEYLEVARCFGASKSMTVLDVILPSSLSFLLSGMRIGLGMAWMAVVAAEMIAAFSGLGYLITISQEMLQVERVLVGMISIGLLGLMLDQFMLGLKKRVIRWG